MLDNNKFKNIKICLKLNKTYNNLTFKICSFLKMLNFKINNIIFSNKLRLNNNNNIKKLIKNTNIKINKILITFNKINFYNKNKIIKICNKNNKILKI